MHDEPPMPSDAASIADWLKHPAVRARIQRARVNAHGVEWHEMAVDAEARNRGRPRQLSSWRRLRALRAYARMRVGSELTALDRQALASILSAGAALVAYTNALNRVGTFGLIEEINNAMKGAETRQDRLVDKMETEGDLVLLVSPALGQPTAKRAPHSIPIEKETDDEAHFEVRDETEPRNGHR